PRRRDHARPAPIPVERQASHRTCTVRGVPDPPHRYRWTSTAPARVYRVAALARRLARRRAPRTAPRGGATAGWRAAPACTTPVAAARGPAPGDARIAAAHSASVRGRTSVARRTEPTRAARPHRVRYLRAGRHSAVASGTGPGPRNHRVARDPDFLLPANAPGHPQAPQCGGWPARALRADP